MKVEKEILMEQIPGLYAVGEILLDKELYYAAASENRGGGLYLVHSMTKEISEIQGCQGVLTCEKRHPWTEDCIDPCEFQSDKQCIIRMGGHEYERK